MGDRLLETFDPADDATPRAARTAAADFARRWISDEGRLTVIALCVSEAVTNVVMHAYRGGRGGPAILEAWHDGTGLTIAVRDHGLGLAPRLDSPGLGMGLALIAQSADESDVRSRPQGGTEVRMTFSAP